MHMHIKLMNTFGNGLIVRLPIHTTGNWIPLCYVQEVWRQRLSDDLHKV